MIIDIKTTWGDRHYVGLSGVEIFTDTGKPVPIANVCYQHLLSRLSCPR